MRVNISIILGSVLILVLYSCKASKQLTSSSNPSLTEKAYIDNYKDIAVSEMKRTGIPASITLAQGMIESDNGRSTLAREANNHFGIKCHNDWSGPKVYHHDDQRNECFRKYGKPEESFYDHSDFLKSGSRYDFLFGLSATDYKGWARGLKKAGYATNPDYANMLIRKIEEENLAYYDHEYNPTVLAQGKKVLVQEFPTVQDSDKSMKPVLPEKTVKPVNSLDESTLVVARVPRVLENNRIQYIVVKDGDTREKIENEFQLLRWELPKYNELKNDFPIVPGQVLYIQPKKEKAEPGKEFYNTVEGDTMYLISQRYGIKLKSLYKMNRMEEDAQPEPGSKIWLRNIKPGD
jgi:LysM repeat protein